MNGHLDVAQWLLDLLGQDINISANKEQAFRYACGNGHLHLAQWLLEVSKEKGQYINISAKAEEAFCLACLRGHLEVCQWLLEVSKERGQNINISVGGEYPFRHSCNKGHLHVAQWLQSLKPYLYVINYDEDGKYKDYYIRSKEEANWEKRKYLLYIATDCKEDNLLYRLPCDVSKMVIGYV
jgi:hypothetical protein